MTYFIHSKRTGEQAISHVRIAKLFRMEWLPFLFPLVKPIYGQTFPSPCYLSFE